MNTGIEFDEKLINKVNLNLSAIKKKASEFALRRTVKKGNKYTHFILYISTYIIKNIKEHQVAWLLRAITCIDLTTLAGGF